MSLRSKTCWVALLATIFGIAPAVAAPVITGNFQVGGVDIAWQAPDGYCMPTGDLATMAQMMAASDTLNVTDLSLVRCSADAGYEDYFIVKTPVNALPALADRTEVLEGVGATFDNPEFAEMLKSGKIDQATGEAFSRVFGATGSIESNIKPLGRDEMCAFLGGIISKIDEGGRKSAAFVGCITSVRKKVLIIYAYGVKTDAAAIAELSVRARRLAVDLAARNVAPR